jgi:cytosine/adenosine deaminase-related metal-dependent hydrolase
MATESAFDRAYLAGVARSIPKARNTARRDVAALPGFPTAEAAGNVVAFGGTVIRADRAIANAWVVVADGVIDGIVTKKPTGMPVITTGGVILPGLIDLHGHPEFNVFAPWEPPKVFINRQQWRASPIYRQLVRDPWEQLTSGGASKSIKKAMTRYAEVRAVVGGVTAIQGASQDYPNKAEALVRNVDLLIFGEQIARSTVDFDRLRPGEFDSLDRAINVTKTAKAHYVHLAEGQKTNEASVNEFVRFAESSLFGAATVVIHGTALRAEHFEQIAAAGAKLVWSPQSNLRLYDETTDIKAALDAGVPIALGADWMPSGSPSLLHEMKIAQRCLAEQGCGVTPRELVAMVTSGAAEIAALGHRLGQLAPGRPADLVVLQRQRTDPYENVVAAYPSWVDLVMIGGDMIYGRAEWIGQLTPIDQYEQVSAWGRRMALDTRFGSPEQSPLEGPPRRLAEIRQRLIARYPEVGPIFF